MEFEQIVKRLEWLDDEQRRSKAVLVDLEERLTSLDSSLELLNKKIKELDKSLSTISVTAARLDQFDQMVTNQRNDFNRALEALEKKHQRRERDAEKRRSAELAPLSEALDELRAALEKTQDFRKALKAREDEESRLNKLIVEIRQRVETAIQLSDESQRSVRVVEESRRQESKRLIDLQGELTAIRKRVDEQRDKIDISNDAFRHIDGRMNELLAAEAERRQAQTAFLEQQALAQVDRDRVWKEMRDKYDAFRQQSEDLDVQVQALDATHRAIKRAQETHEELNQKIERRVNEITEMQRLAEDRIRQEWVTFKADDQKRWTGFSLAQDESLKELHKALAKVEERITALDDNAQTLHDQIEQTTDATERQLEELMNWAHEWLTAYERIMGHTSKPR